MGAKRLTFLAFMLGTSPTATIAATGYRAKPRPRVRGKCWGQLVKRIGARPIALLGHAGLGQ